MKRLTATASLTLGAGLALVAAPPATAARSLQHGQEHPGDQQFRGLYPELSLP